MDDNRVKVAFIMVIALIFYLAIANQGRIQKIENTSIPTSKPTIEATQQIPEPTMISKQTESPVPTIIPIKNRYKGIPVIKEIYKTTMVLQNKPEILNAKKQSSDLNGYMILAGFSMSSSRFASVGDQYKVTTRKGEKLSEGGTKYWGDIEETVRAPELDELGHEGVGALTRALVVVCEKAGLTSKKVPFEYSNSPYYDDYQNKSKKLSDGSIMWPNLTWLFVNTKDFDIIIYCNVSNKNILTVTLTKVTWPNN